VVQSLDPDEPIPPQFPLLTGTLVGRASDCRFISSRGRFGGVEQISAAPRPVVGVRDRRCRGWTLNNRVRRWLAPPRLETELLSLEPGHRVVDLGAGVGYLTSALLERVGPRGAVWLVDPDSRNLSIAQAHWAEDPRVSVVRGSAANVPSIPDRSADRVVLSLVLCCMVDKSGALDEAWRMLRPGGFALVTYPERRRIWSGRMRTLRVTPEVWKRLVVQHPWGVVSSRRRRFIRRQLLQKPDGTARPR
jgi:SAM-dependent methyltransferase